MNKGTEGRQKGNRQPEGLQTENRQQEGIDIIAPPPLIYGLAILVAGLLTWIWPLAIGSHAAIAWAGAGLFAAGFALNIWGVIVLHRAETAINPYHSASSLVATGPFRFSRNPLYVALTMILAGLSLLFNSVWGLVVLPPVLAIMHYGVILREERDLQVQFGQAYRDYCARVRRYL